MSEPFTSTFRTSVFLDAAGNPVRAVTHEQFVGTITNPETGQTFRDRSTPIYTFDYATGENTVDGKFGNITEPGAGTILRGVGRVTFDASGHVIFAAGEPDLTATFFGNAANNGGDAETAFAPIACVALAS